VGASLQLRNDAKIYEWLDLAPVLCRQESKADRADLQAKDHSDGGGTSFNAMKSIHANEASAWITGGWSHFTFTVNLASLVVADSAACASQGALKPFSCAPDDVVEVAIHLQADDFEGYPMQKVPEKPAQDPKDAKAAAATAAAAVAQQNALAQKSQPSQQLPNMLHTPQQPQKQVSKAHCERRSSIAKVSAAATVQLYACLSCLRDLANHKHGHTHTHTHTRARACACTSTHCH
jgi:hypothetical protein